MKQHGYHKSVSCVSDSKQLSQLGDYQVNTKGAKLNIMSKQNLRLSYFKPNMNHNVNRHQNEINENRGKVEQGLIKSQKSIEKQSNQKHNSLANSLMQKDVKKLPITKSSKEKNNSQPALISNPKISFEDDNNQLRTSNSFKPNSHSRSNSYDIPKAKTSNTSSSDNNSHNDKRQIVINQDDDIDTLTKIKNELELMIKQKLEKKKENGNIPLKNYIKSLTQSYENLPSKAHNDKNMHNDINREDKTEGCTFVSVDKIAFPSIKNEYNSQSSDDLKQYFRNNKYQVVNEDCIPETYESNITENRNCYNTNNDSIRDINKELNKLLSAKENKDKDNVNFITNNSPLRSSQQCNKKDSLIGSINENIDPQFNVKSTGKFNEIINWQKKTDSRRESKTPDNNSNINKQKNPFLIEDNTQGEENNQKKQRRNSPRMINEREDCRETFNINNNINIDDNNHLKININTFGNNNHKKFVNDQVPDLNNQKIQEDNKTNMILNKIHQLTIQSNKSVKQIENSNTNVTKDPINDKINQLLNQKKTESNSKNKMKEEILSIITDTNGAIQAKPPLSSLQTNKSFLKSLFQLQTDLIKFQHNSLNNNNNSNNKLINGNNDNSTSIGKNISRNNNDFQLQPQSPITNEFMQKMNQKKCIQNSLFNSEENDLFFNKLSRNNDGFSNGKTNLALLGCTSSNKKGSEIFTKDFYLNKVKEDRLKTNKARSSSVSPQKDQLLYCIITKSQKRNERRGEKDSNSHINVNQGHTFYSLMPANDVNKAHNYVKNFFRKNKIMF